MEYSAIDIRLDLAPLDVAEALREVDVRHRPRAARKGLMLTFDIPAGLPPLMADARRFDQILRRLLDNADKVSDHEARPLTVAELHQGLRQAVWAPTHRATDAATASWQRTLQREHVSRLAASVLRSGGGRADARAIVRLEAETLRRQLQASASSDRTEQAHRRACIDILQSALQAQVVRSSP